VIDLIRLLVRLQQADSLIFERRRFIDKVPLRVNEVDEPIKNARAELEKIKQKGEALLRKKRDKEKSLEEIQDKIRKMRARVSEIKTNKEYQAHLKEIESSEREISGVEDQILQLMVDIDASQKEQAEREKSVGREADKINAFKKELDAEVGKLEKELSQLLEERARIVSSLDPDMYATYLALLKAGNGLAVTRAKDELCQGCDMNIPPQLFVEIKKNEEIIQCPQCRRILYYADEEPEKGSPR
jgi:predicted  nucleic acid-binding Zn-ribbon protein